MANYRARFAMEIFFEAENDEDAKRIFENIDLGNAEFVELEDLSVEDDD